MLGDFPLKSLSYGEYALELPGGKEKVFSWIQQNYASIVDGTFCPSCDSATIIKFGLTYKGLLDLLRQVAVNASCESRKSEAKNLIISCFDRNAGLHEVYGLEKYLALGGKDQRSWYLDRLAEKALRGFDILSGRSELQDPNDFSGKDKTETYISKALKLLDYVSSRDNCSDVRERAGNLYRSIEGRIKTQ